LSFLSTRQLETSKSFDNEKTSDCRIGARHDGNPNGAEDCPPHEGFIMTGGLMLHENGFEWSVCSINAFYKFIKYVSYDLILAQYMIFNAHQETHIFVAFHFSDKIVYLLEYIFINLKKFITARIERSVFTMNLYPMNKCRVFYLEN